MSIASRADQPVLRPGGHLASRMGISAISVPVHFAVAVCHDGEVVRSVAGAASLTAAQS
jgi:hypothetical protein